jgi:hypothetical protein
LERKFTKKGWDGQEVLNRPMSGRKDYTLRMKHAASFFKANQSQLKSEMASGASLEEGRIDTVSTSVEDVEDNASVPRLAEPFHRKTEGRAEKRAERAHVLTIGFLPYLSIYPLLAWAGLALPCPALHNLSLPGLFSLALPGLVLPCLVFSCYALFALVLSCLVSCLVLSGLVLSDLVLFWSCFSYQARQGKIDQARQDQTR